jgi:DNA-binding NarL/FixJ family response regulator
MTSRADTEEQKTVLIVEDHSLLRQVMREFLQSAFPGCSFWEAADSAGALEACNAYRPQLVLMDIDLPDANGIELTARLGTLYPGIQVIVVSHKSGEVYVQQVLAAGARAYVCKDHIVTDLVPAVAAAIGIPSVTEMGTY